MTLKETLLKAQGQAKTAIEQDAVFWLLLELLNITKSDYYLNEDVELETKFIKKYLKNVDEYLINKVPVQYIIGESYFYNYKFYVNNYTLVPRVETEELVFRTINYIKEYFPDKENINILDLATGSGVIGITLKLELKNAKVTISDVSKKALKVARKNVRRYNLDIKTINSDWFNGINDKFDCIISNPPYIPLNQEVEDKVLSEPNNALFSGIEGLDSYKAILSHVNNYLNDKAIIAFEHGYDQKDKLRLIINDNLSNVKIKQEQDLSNKDRYTFIFK
ncbi:MAG TPA: peptide chain release factor N(5)-glutamine methyltransferase [Acholeplasma sp.]|nr:peptide chain release factor N(5)-glutamine methyltransferase [Acholeplasma sp.]